ncbi:L-fucose mutarotase [Metabacillus sp. Hm71]|uniref:L-fucose mutarotase n=1 Tax=Metabacillus sp. Hm71 TaxID=3450743 RepID=UPI003F42838C
MLKGIPSILSPDLMKILLEMGHGDEIVFADGNFPSASCAQRLVRCDGHKIPVLLHAVMKLFPLDTYVEKPLALMKVVPGDSIKPVIWDEYRTIIQEYNGPLNDFEILDRFAFYERAKKAYAIVATSEKALYANIILKKGVLTDFD